MQKLVGPALLVLMALGSAHASAGEPSRDARALIARVHEAAAGKDFTALRALMAQSFTWSFGGDADADQAIGEWRRDPRQLAKLARITAQRCAVQPDRSVECPTKAGPHARARFAAQPDGWKMTSFVEGD